MFSLRERQIVDTKGIVLNQMSSGAVLVTGANTGLGKEVARQLAKLGEYNRIYLACRNPGRARAARADLQRMTGKSIFEVVPVDTADLASARAAITEISGPLHAVVLNAGGAGGATPMALTAEGATTIFAANVLGHVVLLEELIAKQMLTSTAVLVGSEAARGAPVLRRKRPQFRAHSVDEFASVIDGSFFAGRKVEALLAYGQVKYLGALWMSTLARRHPELRLLTVSPGNTSGTEVFRDVGSVRRVILQRIVMPYIAQPFGVAHPLEIGAKRLVDAVSDNSLQSGLFYASAANRLTGPLVDQGIIVSDFRDERIQDAAYDAIHQFITTVQP
jgi:NAD(P)-dependent dehydrogenase (short-subunit alcohol dehydrogenase family)